PAAPDPGNSHGNGRRGDGSRAPCRPGAHDAAAAVHRCADRQQLLDPPPVPHRVDLGDHDRRGHLADPAPPAELAPRPTRPGRGGHDAGPAPDCGGPALLCGRDHRREHGADPRVDEIADGPLPPGAAFLGGGDSRVRLAAGWRQMADAGPEELSAHLAPYARTFAGWFVLQVGGVGRLLLQFLLTVIVAALVYANGETAAHAVLRFARRIAGPSGESAVQLAANAIRAVALGVVVTAALQAALLGICAPIAG